jgi:hypothetical protein
MRFELGDCFYCGILTALHDVWGKWACRRCAEQHGGVRRGDACVAK